MPVPCVGCEEGGHIIAPGGAAVGGVSAKLDPMQANDLEALLRSRVPIIVVDARDESQVLKSLLRACLALAAVRPEPAAGHGGLPLFRWTVTDGLKRMDVEMGPAQRTVAEPLEVLKHIRATNLAGVYALLDFHPYLHEPTVVRMLKDIGQDYERCPRTVVMVSYGCEIPHELEPLTARLSLALPDRGERRQLVEEVARQWTHANPRQAVRIDPRALDLLVENMSGLSAADTQRLARTAIFDHGAIELSDVPQVMRAKYELLNHGGVLRYEHDTAALGDVGGLSNLKQWLHKRLPAFDGSAPELDPPKGVLLLGVQGCGKSLAARACAGAFNIPLLRLDCACLYDKYIGESERNLRETLLAADTLAPCVLWVDEIEKGFAAGDADGGATRRVLGAFLTWLAEKSSRVFVVATANDISVLPPELIRKGRFDEIFFVDLPDAATRAEILRIHAAKRGIRLEPQTLGELAQACDGFSGAEIEQAIVATLYSARAQHVSADARVLRTEIAATRPLAVVMAEDVAALRAWARERTVPAG
jgi:ATPase family associated with various cellular activities (AAA)